MKQVLSAKLKLHTTSAQFQALRHTQVAYRDALNYVSRYSFEHGKLSNKVALQEGTYDEVRARFGLPEAPGLFGSPASGSHLQGLVDQGQAQRQASRVRSHHEALQGPGSPPEVC